MSYNRKRVVTGNEGMEIASNGATSKTELGTGGLCLKDDGSSAAD